MNSVKSQGIRRLRDWRPFEKNQGKSIDTSARSQMVSKAWRVIINVKVITLRMFYSAQCHHLEKTWTQNRSENPLNIVDQFWINAFYTCGNIATCTAAGAGAGKSRGKAFIHPLHSQCFGVNLVGRLYQSPQLWPWAPFLYCPTPSSHPSYIDRPETQCRLGIWPCGILPLGHCMTPHPLNHQRKNTGPSLTHVLTSLAFILCLVYAVHREDASFWGCQFLTIL